MDEKNNQTLTLDDIVHQLTKPSVIQGQDAGKQISTPSSTLPQLPSQQPIPREVRLPSLGNESRTVPSPETLSKNPPTSQRVNTSLLIRTMAQDIERLKMGQRPTPIEVKGAIQPSKQQNPVSVPTPKKIISEDPSKKSILPPLPRPTLSPKTPILIRPYPVSPNLPSQKQTSSSLPPVSTGKPPTKYFPEHYHREEIVGKSDNMLPAYPGAPVPKKIVTPEKENLQYSVLARIIGSGMTAGITITITIAVVAYFLLSFLVFNTEEPILSPSPIATPQITQTPEYNDLELIFKNVDSINFSLPINQVETVTNLKSFIKGADINQNEFKKINFILSDSQVTTITFTDLLDRLSVRYPAALKDALKESNTTLMYGQGEILGEIDSLPDPGLASKKFVLIVEVKDLAKATEILREWELTMPEDLRNVFNIEPSQAATPEFNSNEYRGVSIRYTNFPLPDRSIDYAIVHSLTGHQYLVLTNSRESMYSPVEKITGL